MKRKINNVVDIKLENINSIFSIIRDNDGITRGKIASMSGLSTMSITRIVSSMIDNGFVYEDGEITGSAGRPAKKLRVNTGTYYTMTMYIDVDTVKLAVVDLKNKIVAQTEVASKSIETMQDYIDMAYAAYEDMLKGHDEISKGMACISIVCPGVIDQASGEVVISAQLKWRNAKIVDYASQKFKITTIVDNDVKSALVGEVTYDRRCRDMNVAYIDIGYGIGVGLWIGGQVLRGANNRAGEIGHMVIDYNGQKCECGNVGCLNTVLNMQSIIDRARANDSSITTIEDIETRLKEGTEWAKALFEDISMYFSIAVNDIICAYDPSVIKIGGKFIAQSEGFFNIVSELKAHGKFNDVKIEPALEVSALEDKAYIIGGAINSQNLLINNIFE